MILVLVQILRLQSSPTLSIVSPFMARFGVAPPNSPPEKLIPLTPTTGAPQPGHVPRATLQSGSRPGRRLNLVIVETYQVWTSAGGCRGIRDVL